MVIDFTKVSLFMNDWSRCSSALTHPLHQMSQQGHGARNASCRAQSLPSSPHFPLVNTTGALLPATHNSEAVSFCRLRDSKWIFINTVFAPFFILYNTLYLYSSHSYLLHSLLNIYVLYFG